MLTSVMQSMGPHLRQYLIVIVLNFNSLGTGLGSAWSSPVLVKLSNETSSIFNRAITEGEGTWIASINFISCVLAMYPVALLVDRIGRKYCFFLSSLPRITCYLFLVFATDVWMILVGRLLNGVADAFNFTAVPMYASEVASKNVRGGLGTLFQISCSLGIVIMLCMGPFLNYVLLNQIVLFIVVAATVPLVFLPDSPYFLYKKGKTAEAIKVLTFLRGSAELASEELKEYQANDTDEKTSLKEVFKSRTVLKAMGITTIMAISLQLTGFNAISFYLQTIFVSTRTSVSPELASVVIGLIQFCASLCSIGVIDRFGRKPVLLVTLIGIALGLLGLGTFFYLLDAEYTVVGLLNYLPLISVVLVVFGFSAGMGSLYWPILAELFDGRFRAIGMYNGVQASLVSIFLMLKFFAPVTNLIGPAATYWAFSVNTVFLCVFIVYCVPETKGKSFAEIQAMLDGKECGDDSRIVKTDVVEKIS